MLRVLKLIRPAWGRLAGAAALSTLATACGVALLAVSAWLITRAAGMPPVLTLMVAIVGVRAFGIGRAVFRYAERLVGHDAALRALVEVRVRLYRPLERLAPARYWGTGDLLRRLSADVDALADLVVRGWLPVASTVVVLAAAAGVLFLLLPAAAWWTVAALLVSLLAALLATLRTGRLESASAAVQTDRAAVVAEAVQAAADPAVLHDDRWAGRLAEIDRREERLGAAIGSWTGLAGGITVVAMGLAMALSWFAGRDAGVSGETLTILVLLPLALTDVLLPMPAAFGQVEHGSWVARRLFEVIDAEPADRPEPVRPAAPVSVAVRSLAVSWPGRSTPAVADVDLDLLPGRRIAVVGPSGSGKSTLLAALLGFVPFTGELLLNGGPDPDSNRRAAMSLCDQQAYLFDSTIAENVRLARAAATDDDVSAALRRARLGDWLDSLPNGMHTRVGHLGEMVSGGQRQRIAYARALLADRPILLLDEPTAGLDVETGSALIRDLVDAGPDVCVVLVTHEAHLLVDFDQVLVLPGSAARR